MIARTGALLARIIIPKKKHFCWLRKKLTKEILVEFRYGLIIRPKGQTRHFRKSFNRV